MKNYDLYVGIDVSSEIIDVVISTGEYQKLINDKQDFKELEVLLLPNSLVVMEATGVYHYSLALQISFVDLAPVEKSSGTSVRRRFSINKRENPILRNLLFMCSFNACKSNKRCRQLYERIIAKERVKS